MIRGIGRAIRLEHARLMMFGKLKASMFVNCEKGVLKFDAEKVVQVFGLKAKLGLSPNNEVPPLTLGRADGTTSIQPETLPIRSGNLSKPKKS